MMTDPVRHGNHTAGGGYETSDADFRRVMLTAAGLFGLMIFGLLVSWACYQFFYDRSEDPGTFPGTFATPGNLAPGPLIQQDPHKELVVMRAEEDSILYSYGWIQQQKGIVRVPIDRAMELLLQRGVLERTTP